MSNRILTFLFAVLFAETSARAQTTVKLDIEKPPLSYSETEPDNRVSRLAKKLAAKELKLEYTDEHGYLRSLLKELEIPESSQVLVFSQTSMQVQYISRRNPRAIFFNDDTYLGWVHGSSLVEISTSDPKLGAAFYTVDMAPWRAKLEHRTYDCLACHATSMTQGVPGHTIRSVHPTYDGSIDSKRDSFVTDDRSPFEQRWGGWYVTGEHGRMRHMGNTYLRGGTLDTQDNGNRLNARELFDSSNYLAPYSDIRALMVLEHQAQMHNTMTRADFSVRTMLHEGRIDDDREWTLQLQMIAKEVVDRMLFCDEFPLTDQVKGSVVFESDFVGRGPTDQRGRSLREFDMRTRMFKYPLSYLVYSDAFDSMQPCLRNEISRQILAVLTNENRAEQYRHLDDQTRAHTLAILRATKPEMLRLKGAKNDG